MDKKSLMTPKHWQAPVVGLLGAWFAVSPWIVGPASSGMVSVTHVVLGLALVAAALAMSSMTNGAWGAWLAMAVGLVAAVSPWLLGFAEAREATANAVITGCVAAILGCMVGFVSTDPDSWWNDRAAH
jgi:hypothetical protein